MDAKERKRTHVYDALEILLVLALLVFVCRLWPILLLVILGILAVALRLAFSGDQQAKPVSPQQPQIRRRSPTERNVLDMAYGVIIRRISELVQADFPGARWTWESPQAKAHIGAGEDVYILLDHAGGFRRAKVIIRSLRVVALAYQTEPQAETPRPKSTEPKRTEAESTAKPAPESEPVQEDYSLLAFEWVEANIVDLNRRCNDAIGHGDADLLLTAEELPGKESWEDVCGQLKREGLSDVEVTSSGIRIHLMK